MDSHLAYNLYMANQTSAELLLQKIIRESKEKMFSSVINGETDIKLFSLNEIMCERMEEHLSKIKEKNHYGQLYLKKYQKREPVPCTNCDDIVWQKCHLRYKVFDKN